MDAAARPVALQQRQRKWRVGRYEAEDGGEGHGCCFGGFYRLWRTMEPWAPRESDVFKRVCDVSHQRERRVVKERRKREEKERREENQCRSIYLAQRACGWVRRWQAAGGERARTQPSARTQAGEQETHREKRRTKTRAAKLAAEIEFSRHFSHPFRLLTLSPLCPQRASAEAKVDLLCMHKLRERPQRQRQTKVALVAVDSLSQFLPVCSPSLPLFSPFFHSFLLPLCSET